MINVDGFLKSLPLMGQGMLGIFIVIGIIAASVYLLTKIFPNK